MTATEPARSPSAGSADQTPPEQPETGAETGTEVVAEAPLNREARRARTTQPAPSHVGPQGGRTRQGRGPRSASKRPH